MHNSHLFKKMHYKDRKGEILQFKNVYMQCKGIIGNVHNVQSAVVYEVGEPIYLFSFYQLIAHYC